MHMVGILRLLCFTSALPTIPAITITSKHVYEACKRYKAYKAPTTTTTAHTHRISPLQ